jgi:hypothetical protein
MNHERGNREAKDRHGCRIERFPKAMVERFSPDSTNASGLDPHF